MKTIQLSKDQGPALDGPAARCTVRRRTALGVSAVAIATSFAVAAPGVASAAPPPEDRPGANSPENPGSGDRNSLRETLRNFLYGALDPNMLDSNDPGGVRLHTQKVLDKLAARAASPTRTSVFGLGDAQAVYEGVTEAEKIRKTSPKYLTKKYNKSAKELGDLDRQLQKTDSASKEYKELSALQKKAIEKHLKLAQAIDAQRDDDDPGGTPAKTTGPTQPPKTPTNDGKTRPLTVTPPPGKAKKNTSSKWDPPRATTPSVKAPAIRPFIGRVTPGGKAALLAPLAQLYADSKVQEYLDANQKLLEQARNDPGLRKRIIADYQELKDSGLIGDLKRSFDTSKEFSQGTSRMIGPKLEAYQRELDAWAAKNAQAKKDRQAQADVDEQKALRGLGKKPKSKEEAQAQADRDEQKALRTQGPKAKAKKNSQAQADEDEQKILRGLKTRAELLKDAQTKARKEAEARAKKEAQAKADAVEQKALRTQGPKAAEKKAAQAKADADEKKHATEQIKKDNQKKPKDGKPAAPKAKDDTGKKKDLGPKSDKKGLTAKDKKTGEDKAKARADAHEKKDARTQSAEDKKAAQAKTLADAHESKDARAEAAKNGTGSKAKTDKPADTKTKSDDSKKKKDSPAKTDKKDSDTKGKKSTKSKTK